MTIDNTSENRMSEILRYLGDSIDLLRSLQEKDLEPDVRHTIDHVLNRLGPAHHSLKIYVDLRTH